MLERRTGGGRRAAIAAGVVAICSAAGAGLWYQLHPGPLHAPDPTPITSDPGTTREPASSADGKLLAYSSDRNNPAGDLNIWLQNMETGKTRQITTDPGNEDEPALSPDGKLIAWRSSRGDTVFLRPVAGGAPRELARQAHIPRFSPDGRYIAWWQGAEDDPNIRATIWVTPLDAGPGEEPRQLATDFADARLPSWTPDGRYILFRGSRAASASKGPIDDWWLASLDGSPPRPTGIGPRLRSAGLEAHESPVLWDGSQIMFAARLQSESVNLWSVRFLRLLGRSFVLGAPTTVTTSPNLQDTPAFLTGRRVAYTEWREQINLFRIDLSSGDLKPITGQQTFDTKVSVSADGQTLVFGRFHGTYRDVWLKDRRAPEGENERQLSDRKEMAVPFVSPDGRTAAVSSGTAIRLIDIATTSEAPVCSDCGELRGWMPRTQQLLYWENTPPAPSVRLLDLATRTKTTLLSAPSLNDSVVSPDGNTLAFTIRADGAHSVIYISRLDQSGAGGPWTRITPEEGWADKPLWSPDGKTLYFSSNLDGFLCIWKRQVDPARLRANGEIQEVRHFHKASQSLWQLSPSGFALALGGGGLFLSVDIAQTNIVAVRR